MTAQETILQSGLALRDLLRINVGAKRIIIERADGTWTYVAGEGLRLRSGDRSLRVPESVFEAAEAEAWEVVGS